MQVFCPSLSCLLHLLTTCHVVLSNGVISLMAVSFPRNCDRDLTMIGTVTMIMIMMIIMMEGRVMVMIKCHDDNGDDDDYYDNGDEVTTTVMTARAVRIKKMIMMVIMMMMMMMMMMMTMMVVVVTILIISGSNHSFYFISELHVQWLFEVLSLSLSFAASYTQHNQQNHYYSSKHSC